MPCLKVSQIAPHQLMGTTANSEDPDEMLHNAAAFHQGLHYLLRQNPSPEIDIQFF